MIMIIDMLSIETYTLRTRFPIQLKNSACFLFDRRHTNTKDTRIMVSEVLRMVPYTLRSIFRSFQNRMPMLMLT